MARHVPTQDQRLQLRHLPLPLLVHTAFHGQHPGSPLVLARGHDGHVRGPVLHVQQGRARGERARGLGVEGRDLTTAARHGARAGPTGPAVGVRDGGVHRARVSDGLWMYGPVHRVHGRE